MISDAFKRVDSVKLKYAILGMAILSVAAFAQGACGVAASNPTYNVCIAMRDLCGGINTLIPVASMLMLVIAAVIYAAGQMMGAETRARANVWATAALVGALIGVLIVAIAPPVLNAMYAPTSGVGISASICSSP